MSHRDADRHAAIPYIAIKGAARAIEFYRKAFAAQPGLWLAGPDGTVMHGEFTIEGAKIMCSEEFPEHGARSPESLQGTSCGIAIYVKDVDAFADRAVKAGVEVLRPVADEFYGDRAFKCRCPFGHIWNFATPYKHVSDEEVVEAFRAMMAEH